MLPSLSSFAKFENTHNTTGLPFRTCASSVHNEQLPSIFELVPELSDGSPKDFHIPLWHESEPRYHGLRNFQIMNTCTASNPSIYSHSKHRRLSVDNEEETRKSREGLDFRPRDAVPFSGQWNCFQKTNTPTPDPSPSSRRSSTFSSTETWTGSPPSNRYANIPSSQRVDHDSSPFSRTESLSRPDSHRGLSNGSCSNFPLLKESLEVNGTNICRSQERHLHNLPTLNLGYQSHGSSRSSRTDNEYYFEMPPSVTHTSQPPPEPFHSPGSKTDSFGGYPHSENITCTVMPPVSNQFPNDVPSHKAISRDHSLYQGDSGHEIYLENNCHYNNDDTVGVRDRENKPRKRRGNLPKDTTDKLRTWFLNHLEHPYPTEDEKQQLMDSTGLQMNQISNWYINARRRQLPAITANARAEAEARRHVQCSSNVPSLKKCEA